MPPTVVAISALRRAFGQLQAIAVGDMSSAERLTYLTLAALTEANARTNHDGAFMVETVADISRQTEYDASRYLTMLTARRLVRRSARNVVPVTFQLRWDR
jgi:hypothetical protein